MKKVKFVLLLVIVGNLIMGRAVEILTEKGIKPPVWTSVNIKGGDEANQGHLKKYLPRVHHLYRMF